MCDVCESEASESSDHSENSDNERDLPDMNLHNNLIELANLADLQSEGLEVIDMHWFDIPKRFIQPKTMCAVNQFVHVVDSLSPLFLSTSCELVLFGVGLSIPEHFRWMIHVTEMINSTPSIKGCYVSSQNMTRGVYVSSGKQTSKSKNFDVIGIERKVSVDNHRDESKRQNFPETLTPWDTFTAKCDKITEMSGAETYARVNLVQLNWGLIPVQYEEDGETKRRVFQVLRVIPQPGLHLMELIRKKYFQKRNDNRLKEFHQINEVCHLLQLIVNHEADVNYGMIGIWNDRRPSPWSVSDPVCATSVQRILSPFTVLERLLHHLPGGFCGSVKCNESSTLDNSSIIIDGFPSIASPESLENVLQFYETKQDKYLAALRNYDIDFFKNVGGYSTDPESEYAFEPILSSRSGDNYNFLNPRMNLIFTLQNYMKFSKEKMFCDADRITLPKLAIAIMDLFLFFQLNACIEGMNSEDFITAHVGEHAANDVVTETKIALKYRATDVSSLEDFPKAGQFKSARDGFKRNLVKLMSGKDDLEYAVTNDVYSFYLSYMRLQYTSLFNGLLMDSWMSDRVFRCATLTQQLVSDNCPCKMTREALKWAWDNVGDENKTGPQCISHDEICFSWARLNSALCFMNRSIKANPLNLTIIWGMLKSDVLTFLGLHNQSWRWIMYCMQIAPLYGHMRAHTEDGHAAKSDCILTAKPNSVGLNEVIVKTVNYCLEGLLTYIISIGDDDRRVLRLEKVDRKTRAGMEASQGVELANGRVIGKPTSSNLMQAVAVDEALRSFDESALAALINTGLPRDSNAGEGATTKILKPERGYNEKGETRQLPGMGWYVLCFATNTNARNSTIAEMLRTLSCGAMISYAPGAPQSQGLATALNIRDKRKRGQTVKSSTSIGESMLPAEASHCKYLAYLFSVSSIFSRHIGLVNKTGQSDWEISIPLQMYLDTMKQYFFDHFSEFVSGNFSQSCDRQFKGFIARSVSACLMCTTVNNLEQYEDAKEANFQTLLSMESSALTLYWANMALLNGFTHLTDASLCIITQLIRWKLNVPVLNLKFLCDILDPDCSVDHSSEDFVELRRFLERLRNSKMNDEGSVNRDSIKHFTGSYVQVPNLGSSVDYGHVENYLLKYCGINMGMIYTYLKMFKDAAHKTLDLTVALDLPHSMLDVRVLFRRCGVRYDDHWYVPPGNLHEKGTNFLILIADPQDTKATTNVGVVWAHVVQALILNAMLGPRELHADNSIALGQSIFSLIASRTLPQQAVPSTALLLETFAYRYGDVQNDYLQVSCTRDYFYRPRICHEGWRNGIIKSMNSILGKHPLEDVIHIHGWIQTHYMLCGRLPTTFYYMPPNIVRGAELLPGRIYPVFDRKHQSGVFCVCPEGRAFALLKMQGSDFEVLPVNRWQMFLAEKEIQVAPLIYRKHAVMMNEDQDLGIFAQQSISLPANLLVEEEMNDLIHANICNFNYLNFDGEYKIYMDDQTEILVDWQTAHSMLLVLGTHIAVTTESIKRYMVKDKNTQGTEVPRAKIPNTTASHVVGYLRYPDECDHEYDSNIYVHVAFRIKTPINDFDDVCILPLPTVVCTLPQSLDRVQTIDFLIPNA